ncbi:hypothetical protein GSI_08799 [Ganoderma sinense ZZ0214-1]|uniref:Uncharacterized protein n=1 Tax=Ganoderma sinense ZZ0214-1 TaxID=1077348 RepID=A0A2G8S4T4_9APHY|nr:hypothetical protein GSI_08799 [Ganoderma sinense ZZ0214-1]
MANRKPMVEDVISGSYHQPMTVSLSPWAQGALQPGYIVSELTSLPPPSSDHWPTPDNSSCLWLQIHDKNYMVNLVIQYRHMRTIGIHSGAAIEARIWIPISPNSTLDGIPPYTSVIWHIYEWESALRMQNVHVLTQSGEEMTLRLWLGIAQYGHYHTHVEVMTNVESPTQAHVSTRHWDVSDVNCKVGDQHTDLKFTMLGSVRRALEVQGYSIHLDQPGEKCSSSLFLSNSRFNIFVRYFYATHTSPDPYLPTILTHDKQELVVTACVTLELPLDPRHSSGGYMHGPYVARWSDSQRGDGWRWSHEHKKIGFTAPTGELLTLSLGLDLAWVSEYYLVVDIEHLGECSPQIERIEPSVHDMPFRLVDPHYDTISLKLPRHTKCALQAHGYEARFEGPNDDHSNLYHLTLSDVEGDLEINIGYSYSLSRDLNGRQGLAFRACITTPLVLQSSQGPAPQPECQTVNWDAWHVETSSSGGDIDKQGGWHWKLPDEDVKLSLPNGLELTLRLGLYLIWLSEYCITIEVIPPKPLSQTTSHKSLGSSGESTESGSGEADVGEDLDKQGTALGELTMRSESPRWSRRWRYPMLDMDNSDVEGVDSSDCEESE